MTKILLFNDINCTHCQYVQPIINQVSKELDIDIEEYLNDEEYFEIRKHYSVVATPTIIVINHEKPIVRFVGYPENNTIEENILFFKEAIEKKLKEKNT